MDGREVILGAIRANKPKPVARPQITSFGRGDGDGDKLTRFIQAFKSMGGTWLEPGSAEKLAPITDRIADAAHVVSLVPEVAGNRNLDLYAEPSSFANVDVAIVRAAFGISETGSVAFTEREIGVNTLVYLSQHLIVLLDPADIVADVHAAYERPEFMRARYLVFHTGPSATADIEGVLIHGAQGVRSLCIMPFARSS